MSEHRSGPDPRYGPAPSGPPSPAASPGPSSRPGPAGPPADGQGEGHEGHGLSTAKVAGQALAAVTTAGVGAVLGGASGTVAGAALASVVTTVGDAVYQRSLERTGHRVRRRLHTRRTRADGADGGPASPDEVPAARRPEPATRVAAPVAAAVGAASATAVTVRMRPVGRHGAGGPGSEGAHTPPPAPDDTPTSFIPPVGRDGRGADRTSALGAGPGTRVLPGGGGPGDPATRWEGPGPDDPHGEDDPYGDPYGDGDDDAERPPPTGKRPWARYAVLAGTAVVIFLVAMIAITGIERVKGSPLSGGTGTSVGEVFGTRSATPTATTGADAGDETSATTAPGRTTASSAPRQDRATTTARTPTRTSAPAATPTPTS